MISIETKRQLIECAIEAQTKSYSPYSNYKVGAALLAEDDKGELIFPGCNVENASYPCGICAERTALAQAVSNGFRKFKAIAIVGSSDEFCTPCGMCRQALYEFAPDLLVICANQKGEFEEHVLKDLLPFGFGPNSMN